VWLKRWGFGCDHQYDLPALHIGADNQCRRDIIHIYADNRRRRDAHISTINGD
jgi:hypothetical protein